MRCSFWRPTNSRPLVAGCSTLVIQSGVAPISGGLLEHSSTSSLVDTNQWQLAQKGSLSLGSWPMRRTRLLGSNANRALAYPVYPNFFFFNFAQKAKVEVRFPADCCSLGTEKTWIQSNNRSTASASSARLLTRWTVWHSAAYCSMSLSPCLHCNGGSGLNHNMRRARRLI